MGNSNEQPENENLVVEDASDEILQALEEKEEASQEAGVDTTQGTIDVDAFLDDMGYGDSVEVVDTDSNKHYIVLCKDKTYYYIPKDEWVAEGGAVADYPEDILKGYYQYTDGSSKTFGNFELAQTRGQEDLTIQERINNLAYKDAGDKYEIRYVNSDGVTKNGRLVWDEDGTYHYEDFATGEPIEVDENTVKILDTNAYRSVADQYETISESPETTAKLHGVGSRDREDIHDVALVDFERPSDGEVIHEGEGIMWHTHVTQTSGSGEVRKDDGGTYAPGQQINLASNPKFQALIKENASKNVFKDAVGKKSFSKNEFIAAYASSGQYSAKDLSLTAAALEEYGLQNFSECSSTFFYNTEFETIYEEIKDEDWSAKADEYNELVVTLKEEFKKLHDSITGWTGSASKSERATLECILGKFEVTIGNIECALVPSCDAMIPFIDDLLELRELEKTYIESHGFLLPNGETSQCKDVTPIERNYNKVKEEKEAEESKKVEQYKYEYVTEKDENGNDKVDENGNVVMTRKQTIRPEYTAWVNRCNDLKAEFEKISEIDATNLANLEAQLKLVITDYYQIKNFETTVQSYSEYFLNKDSKQYKWLHGGSGSEFSKNSIIASHDYIIDDFEDYSRMPVITNLSDYHVGDVVAFDDAHGYVYAVSGEFDPLTGTIKIACYDKDGNQVGSEIKIWDQREIVKIKYVREYDDFYEEYPDTFPIGTEAPDTTPDDTIPDTKTPGTTTPGTTTPGTTTPGTTTPGTTTPSTTTPSTTTPSTTTPSTTTPSTTTPSTTTPSTTTPSTTTPSTTTPSTTTPSTTTPITEPIPSIPVITIPYTTIDYGGEGEGEEVKPHTGLNSVYATGDTKQSASGLGALAGLAAGAAGLGLTGLLGDKDEEEDEEKEETQKIEEKEEEKTEEKAEETSNDSSSQPTSF